MSAKKRELRASSHDLAERREKKMNEDGIRRREDLELPERRSEERNKDECQVLQKTQP